ncbi:MAG: cysteine desulfurase [Candidatus Altiarchaeota archaeon]|nr:cysteine desulfurase [Candidatus Altiarchaeota archaeon]
MNIETIRNDFPVLKKDVIYLDSSCVSLKPKQVVEAMNKYYYEFPACAGRSIHGFGSKVSGEITAARKNLANFFSTKPNEIIFTRNATEGINLVANSLGLKSGDKVLTSDKEHNSNLLPWQNLTKEGILHQVVLSNQDNTFNLAEFEKQIEGTRLVSIVHTSNLDGVSFPVEKIIKIAHRNGALVLLDCAQSAPHKELNMRKLDADFMVCSGHKMLGPSGIGALYGKAKLLDQLQPFLLGGSTVRDATYTSAEFEGAPAKFEAGLQNYAGIIGFSEAVTYLRNIGMKKIQHHEQELNKQLTDELLNLEAISLIGPAGPSQRAGIFSFNIKDKDPHEVALMLDQSAKIMVRSGAHCVHSWFNARNLKGSVRASLYLYNTEEECTTFIDAVKAIATL